MTASKSLPSHPSEESLRKQASKLSRDVAAGDVAALDRARAQLHDLHLPLARRDAQLVLAREYGFAGWSDLLAEVQKRRGRELDWAIAQARRIIHDSDVASLRQLLTEYPALLGDGNLLAVATRSFGDSGDPQREQQFTRFECAELLLDAGAVVLPAVCDGLVDARARGLLQLFERRGVLPRTLTFRIALNDMDAVRACVDAGNDDLETINEAFMCACRFEHEPIASFLLQRSTALDAELGARVDGGPGRAAFIQYLIRWRVLDLIDVRPGGPWQAFVMQQLVRTVHDKNLASFVHGLRRDPWLLGDSHVDFQVGLVERATLHDCEAFITALLELDPAMLRRRPPPPSQALEFALTYAKSDLVPTLTRVWPLPDDLPHAAGMGDLDRVKRWFDASGEPELGDLANHFPCNSAYARDNLQWGEPSTQQALDTALAWSVLNGHFDVADFLLAHGADINTRWSSHEPASILHELVGRGDYEAMRFLIDRGIDMTIVDYRWGGTAQGWAYHAVNNEEMARWLGEAERQRKGGSR